MASSHLQTALQSSYQTWSCLYSWFLYWHTILGAGVGWTPGCGASVFTGFGAIVETPGSGAMVETPGCGVRYGLGVRFGFGAGVGAMNWQ